MLHKTSLVITNRTVEIEREGANVFLTALTCGCWYLCFQTASIEIYEVGGAAASVAPWHTPAPAPCPAAPAPTATQAGNRCSPPAQRRQLVRRSAAAPAVRADRCCPISA